jgi:hypothetical protein
MNRVAELVSGCRENTILYLRYVVSSTDSFIYSMVSERHVL